MSSLQVHRKFIARLIDRTGGHMHTIYGRRMRREAEGGGESLMEDPEKGKLGVARLPMRTLALYH